MTTNVDEQTVMPVEVQQVSAVAVLPAGAEIAGWVTQALASVAPEQLDRDVCVRIVDEPEGRALNQQYRGIDKATNVLSFASELPTTNATAGPHSGPHSGPHKGSKMGPKLPLGDLVICAPVLLGEATSQAKTPRAHTAHLVLHGLLHLLGHDHEQEAQAQVMEGLEVALLAQLNIGNPYSVSNANTAGVCCE